LQTSTIQTSFVFHSFTILKLDRTILQECGNIFTPFEANYVNVVIVTGKVHFICNMSIHEQSVICRPESKMQATGDMHRFQNWKVTLYLSHRFAQTINECVINNVDWATFAEWQETKC